MICAVCTLSIAALISASMTSSALAGSNESIAVMPCGTVLVGMTMTFLSDSGMHCWAAMMMFLLFGSTNTTSAGVLLTSVRMSSVEGFMVWPPVTTRSTPSSRKRFAMPSPADTATTPNCFSGLATSGSASALAAASASVSLPESAVCWLRMFSIFTVWSGP